MGLLQMAKNKWVTRVIITPVSGVITLLITEKGPPCRTLNLCSFLHQPLQWICWVARYAPKKTSINHDEIYQTYQTCQRCFRITQAWGFTAQTRLAVGHDEIWQSIRILCSIAVLNSPPQKKGDGKTSLGMVRVPSLNPTDCTSKFELENHFLSWGFLLRMSCTVMYRTLWGVLGHRV